MNALPISLWNNTVVMPDSFPDFLTWKLQRQQTCSNFNRIPTHIKLLSAT